MENPMTSQQHRLSLAIAMALALLPAAEAIGGVQATELDTIVVTATRTEIHAEDAKVPVQVLDRELIERSQATSLLDLLRGRAGISLRSEERRVGKEGEPRWSP